MNPKYTLAQDRALLAAILQLPAQKLLAVVVFLWLRERWERDGLLAYLKQVVA